MKEYTITRYSFEELSPEAQEKALETGDIFLLSGKVDHPAGVNA